MPAMRAPKPSTTHARTHARTHPLPLAHTLSPSHTQASAPLLTRELEAAGLHAARLLWLPLQPRVTHLRRAQRMGGLSLDTPGYNQGTSGLDALWAGLPLLSLPLSQWCGRMGLGLLRGVALLPGAVHTRREIEDGVVALGRDDLATGALSIRPAELRSWLRPRRGRRRDGRPVPQPIEVIL